MSLQAQIERGYDHETQDDLRTLARRIAETKRILAGLVRRRDALLANVEHSAQFAPVPDQLLDDVLGDSPASPISCTHQLKGLPPDFIDQDWDGQG